MKIFGVCVRRGLGCKLGPRGLIAAEGLRCCTWPQSLQLVVPVLLLILAACDARTGTLAPDQFRDAAKKVDPMSKLGAQVDAEPKDDARAQAIQAVVRQPEIRRPIIFVCRTPDSVAAVTARPSAINTLAVNVARPDWARRIPIEQTYRRWVNDHLAAWEAAKAAPASYDLLAIVQIRYPYFNAFIDAAGWCEPSLYYRTWLAAEEFRIDGLIAGHRTYTGVDVEKYGENVKWKTLDAECVRRAVAPVAGRIDYAFPAHLGTHYSDASAQVIGETLGRVAIAPSYYDGSHRDWRLKDLPPGVGVHLIVTLAKHQIGDTVLATYVPADLPRVLSIIDPDRPVFIWPEPYHESAAVGAAVVGVLSGGSQ